MSISLFNYLNKVVPSFQHNVYYIPSLLFLLSAFQCFKIQSIFLKKYCLSYSCRTMSNTKALTDGHSACFGVHALWCLRSFPSCPSTVLFPMGVWHLLCNQHRCCLFSLWLRQLKWFRAFIYWEFKIFKESVQPGRVLRTYIILAWTP